MALTLGIDLGTTSVKISIADSAGKKMYSDSQNTGSDVKGDGSLGESLQDVSKIYQTVVQLITNIPQEILRSVDKIGFCGQMHGVVYWKDKEGWTHNLKNELQVGSGVSYLHTWQDARCTPDFLSTLPDSSTRINSGYGCATTFWFLKHDPQFIQQFNRCGTVMDFFVCMLLNLDQPVITDQNATSFGYFNPTSKNWDSEILNAAGFPVQILPKVVSAGCPAGKLKSDWFGVKSGTNVFAALGDFQSSVRSMIENVDEDGILNFSTSAQIAFLTKRSECDFPDSIDFFPYFKGSDLAVAASLNGGNVLDAFVNMVEEWTLKLGAQISKETIWREMIRAGEANQESDSQATLQINPLLFGERHNPEIRGSINNIRNDNLRFNSVVKSLYDGLVNNLIEMMPPHILKDRGVKRIVSSGSALIKHKGLQNALKDAYGLPIVLMEEGDSSFGVALAVSDNTII